MIIYLCGPISGDPDYHDKFHRAEEVLQTGGHIVLNPAVLPAGMNEKKYLPITLAMLEQAEAVFLLPGWSDSGGAVAEEAVARRQGKMLIYPEGGIVWNR